VGFGASILIENCCNGDDKGVLPLCCVFAAKGALRSSRVLRGTIGEYSCTFLHNNKNLTLSRECQLGYTKNILNIGRNLQ
jgi:hypothetical protein